MQRAKKAVQANIRAKGQRLADFSAREITVLAEDYLAQHREQLRAEAEHAIATWPGFARWRLPDCANLSTFVQIRKARQSSLSTLRNSGTKLMTIIGYARVSTDGQSLQSQTEALHLADCGRVYSEKISGAYSDRPQLAKAIAALGEGDTLIVTKLDRLARSTRDLLNTLDAIGKAGATFKSLGDSWANTDTAHGRLMLVILGGLAEFERHLILSRTAEGRTRAQANGVRFGRKPSLTAYQRAEALRRRAAGETLTEIARSFNVSHMTIARLEGE
jgi:DNA invertase Pin-like site-specific DNA recombinase